MQAAMTIDLDLTVPGWTEFLPVITFRIEVYTVDGENVTWSTCAPQESKRAETCNLIVSPPTE